MLSMFKRTTPEQEQGVAGAEQEQGVAGAEQEQGVAGAEQEQGVAGAEQEQGEDLAAALDDTRRRLFRQLVAADGRVRDPETIDYAAELVDDPAALSARITAELEARPGIGRHAAGGDIGAGITGDPGPADLIDAIRAAHQSDY